MLLLGRWWLSGVEGEEEGKLLAHFLLDVLFAPAANVFSLLAF